MLERDLQHYFIALVYKAGGRAYKVDSTTKRGFPDLVVALDGVLRLVEMKSPTGKLSHHQKCLHDELAEQLIAVTVISSREEADQFIKDWHYDPN